MGTEDDNLTVFHSGMAVSLFFLMLSIKLSAQEQGRESSICVITDVVKGSIADRLGLKTGDIILSINDKEIHSDASFIKGIKSAKGSVIKIKILRKGKEIVFKTPFYADKLGIYFTFCERDRLLSPEEMKEDLDTLFSAIVEIHPNPYASISKEEFDSLKSEVYKSINKSMSISDFWKITAPVVASIGDGHTYLNMPDGEWFYQLTSDNRFIFPILLHIIQDSVLVKKNFSSAPIRSGDYILSINDVPIRKIINECIPYISGELYHFKISLLERNFPQLLFFIYGFKSSFKVKIKNVDGEIREYNLEGIDKKEYDKKISDTCDTNFYFEEIPELKTCIIRFNFFTRREEFSKFLKKTFTEIKRENYKYLIIDLRKNGGGSSEIAEDLLDYLTAKPYRFFGGGKVKISKYTLKFVKENLSIKKPVVDTFYTFKSDLKMPPPNPLRFTGKLFVLVSNYTFSTASGFAAVIKDFQIGTLIGEETGGLPTCFGDSWSVILPNSHLSLYVSWKYFIRPNGDSRYIRKGVIPDIIVKTTEKDLEEGVDPVMEKVEEIIAESLK